MDIKLTPAFRQAYLQKEFDKFINQIIQAIKVELSALAGKSVDYARSKVGTSGGFNNDTGNLMSSEFAVLMYDGQVLYENFKPATGGTDKVTGEAKGREFAQENKKSTGWAIILGAGMEYASYVEAKNRDVITGGSIFAEENLQSALNRVLKRLK